MADQMQIECKRCGRDGEYRESVFGRPRFFCHSCDSDRIQKTTSSTILARRGRRVDDIPLRRASSGVRIRRIREPGGVTRLTPDFRGTSPTVFQRLDSLETRLSILENKQWILPSFGTNQEGGSVPPRPPLSTVGHVPDTDPDIQLHRVGLAEILDRHMMTKSGTAFTTLFGHSDWAKDIPTEDLESLVRDYVSPSIGLPQDNPPMSEKGKEKEPPGGEA